MIGDRFKYAMLLSSLPVHPVNLFATKNTPLSRIQLDNRLSMLDETDAYDLNQIEDLLHWSRINEQDDEMIVQYNIQALAAIQKSFLKEIVSWRLELRTIISALRKRHAGAVLSANSVFHGFGKWPFLLKRRWQEPDFGVGHLLPWLPEANRLLENGDALGFEKLLLDLVWRHYSRVGSRHYFDFEAVVIYVLRWDVSQRWVSYNQKSALVRFDQLIAAGLAGVSLEC